MPRVPASSYRIQLRSGVDFARCSTLLGYLQSLGVDWLYLSPIQAARPESSHGYDVVDPTRIDPALGGESGFQALAAEAARRGMGILLDIVPNHMAADEHDPWWWDVLLRGPESEHAAVFDIDWDAGGGRLLLPVLGDELERVLARGELRVDCSGGAARLCYFDLTLPVRGDPERELRELLEDQGYRLRYWRGRAPLNYRRFFTISELVGVRAGDPAVFDKTHALALSLVANGSVQGLRVDHPDGLSDPLGYTERLAAEATRAAGGERPYLVLEKILGDEERLRDELPVDGTTGYEALALLDALFVDPAGARRVQESYVRFTGRPRDFEEVVLAAKQRVQTTSLAPELENLARRIQLCLPELALAEVREALGQILACFPVYRSYVRPGAERVEGEDRRLFEAAVTRARERAPALSRALDLVGSVLLLERGPLEPARRALLRFQQLSGPAAAKGVEDTALYRWFPLASLCEVGANPASLGLGIEAFHRINSERARTLPHSLIATTTHDTKRSEDVRARLDALSELADAWTRALEQWSRENAPAKRAVDGAPAPDANDEYLIYQTLLGIWPMTPPDEELGARLREYVVKALREAKRASAWIDPNSDYESAAVEFVDALLDPARSPPFTSSLHALQTLLARAGMQTSLSRTVLKAAMPGVPDFYQGSELWDLSLVDPDNRRPVDFDAHARMLSGLGESPNASELFECWRDGRIKLWLTRQALHVRRKKRALFASGAYRPLLAGGPAAERVIAFAREHAGDTVIAVAARFFVHAEPWNDTTLTTVPGRYRDVLSGREHRLGATCLVEELLADLPCALLERLA